MMLAFESVAGVFSDNGLPRLLYRTLEIYREHFAVGCLEIGSHIDERASLPVGANSASSRSTTGLTGVLMLGFLGSPRSA